MGQYDNGFTLPALGIDGADPDDTSFQNSLTPFLATETHGMTRKKDSLHKTQKPDHGG